MLYPHQKTARAHAHDFAAELGKLSKPNAPFNKGPTGEDEVVPDAGGVEVDLEAVKPTARIFLPVPWAALTPTRPYCPSVQFLIPDTIPVLGVDAELVRGAGEAYSPVHVHCGSGACSVHGY